MFTISRSQLADDEVPVRSRARRRIGVVVAGMTVALAVARFAAPAASALPAQGSNGCDGHLLAGVNSTMQAMSRPTTTASPSATTSRSWTGTSRWA